VIQGVCVVSAARIISWPLGCRSAFASGRLLAPCRYFSIITSLLALPIRARVTCDPACFFYVRVITLPALNFGSVMRALIFSE
jgi:hypothetical protein